MSLLLRFYLYPHKLEGRIIPNYLESVRYKPPSIVPRIEVYGADKPGTYIPIVTFLRVPFAQPSVTLRRCKKPRYIEIVFESRFDHRFLYSSVYIQHGIPFHYSLAPPSRLYSLSLKRFFFYTISFRNYHEKKGRYWLLLHNSEG